MAHIVLVDTFFSRSRVFRRSNHQRANFGRKLSGVSLGLVALINRGPAFLEQLRHTTARNRARVAGIDHQRDDHTARRRRRNDRRQLLVANVFGARVRINRHERLIDLLARCERVATQRTVTGVRKERDITRLRARQHCRQRVDDRLPRGLLIEQHAHIRTLKSESCGNDLRD